MTGHGGRGLSSQPSGGRGSWISEFKSSLVYRVSSRLGYIDSVSENNNKNKIRKKRGEREREGEEERERERERGRPGREQGCGAVRS